MRYLIALIAACLLNAASAQPFNTPRSYSATNGTVELAAAYGVNHKRDKTLRDLGYTQQDAVNNFPAFNMWWTAHGWPSSELLNLYEFECAFNDAVFSADTYLGIGIYVRSNYVTQSRIWVKCPDGWYRVRFGCMTGLGRYSGKHAQVYSDRSGANPGCTPGTCIEIDHAGWSPRQPDRVCLNSTAWGKDYGVIGGLAYTEGIIIESFRFVGNKSQAGFFAGLSTGVTLNEPGENSVIRECMSTDFKGAGYTVFNGTPTVIETCSAFNNDGPGFDLLGSNGLCNIRLETPSGDNNAGGLVKIRPKDAQSVGGGTITITNMKSESRGVLQRPIVIEGAMGDLNLCIDGMTANFDNVTCDYLIGGNWTGDQFEISARGIDLRSNTQALFSHGGKGWTLTGGKPYSGNSFTVNDEGLAFKSRPNMQMNPSTPACTWIPGTETCGACTNNSQTCTTPYVSSVAGCTPSGTKPAALTRTQACGTPPPTGNAIAITIKPTVSGTNSGGRELPEYAIDGNASTVWSNGARQDAGDAFIQFDAGSEVTWTSATFSAGWVSDYARTPQVYVGNSATATTTTAATITGTSTMTVTFATPVKGRYFRLTAKKTNGVSNWFTVGEAKFYRP